MISQMAKWFRDCQRNAVRRSRRRSQSPGVEQFEPRQLLTATLVADLNPGTTEFGPIIYPDTDFRGRGSAAWNGEFYYDDSYNDRLVKIVPGGLEVLHEGEYGWRASWLTPAGDQLFFQARDAAAGYELFVSDGTAAGTSLLKDINPDGSSFPELLTPVGDKLFFAALDPQYGYELWTSDGTTAGTSMVTDLLPGPETPYIWDITPAGGAVYFAATLPGCGRELFRSDGTAAGTTLVADLKAGPEGSFPGDLVRAGGMLYFTVFGAGGPMSGVRELWVTDGTAAGTVPVLDGDGLTVSGAASLVALGDTVLFSLPGAAGAELWRASGESAALVRDIQPGDTGSSPEGLTVMGGAVYFWADDGVNGRELWSSDGTESGTVLVTDLNSGGDAGGKDLTASSDLLYFTADDGQSGVSVWRSDGTNTGTFRLGDMVPDHNNYEGMMNPGFKVSGDRVFFKADDGAITGQVWATDGTVAGTNTVSTPWVLKNSSDADWLREIDGSLWFTAMNQNYTANVKALYRSDGTESGTLRFVEPSWSGLSFIEDPREFGGEIYFTAFDSQFSRQIWKTDGTAAGTVPVTAFAGGGLEQYATLIEFNNELYFMADDGLHGYELYATDSTIAGTRLVMDINPGPDSSSLGMFEDLRGATILNDVLYFTATNGTEGYELWRTDGTAAGTSMVIDLWTGADSGRPDSIKVLNGCLTFAAMTSYSGWQLWSSDGTALGTQLLSDAYVMWSYPSSLLVVPGLTGGSVLYFAADDGVHGTELWKSDGTAQGTVLAMDVNPGAASSNPANLTVGFTGSGGTAEVYFAADDGAHGTETWIGRSDGVTLLMDLNPGFASSLPIFYAADDLVYLFAYDEVHVRAPWQTDGTADGTQLVDDINTTELVEDFMGWARMGSYMYFSTTGPAGGELYRAPINHRPSSVSLTNQLVAENRASGTVVGTLAATDPDVGDIVTFSLTAGEGATDNALFVIQNGVLKTLASFNYEARSTYSIRVRATDSNGQTRDQIFAIQVANEIELVGLDVQLGQSQRSWIRYADMVFAGVQDVTDLLNGGWNQFRLTRSTLDNTLPVNVPLLSSMISQSQNAVRFDFGVNGLGGNRNTNAGDGYYELAWDRSRNGSFTAKKYFYRLLGDVNGDRRVDATDSTLVTNSLGLLNPERDVNGDGIVNANDRTLVLRAVGRKLKDGLFTDD
ncbi:MAG: ELWxxDGT repeat protein [Planctomycetaceae bacterium]